MSNIPSQFDKSAFENEIHIETKQKYFAVPQAELDLLVETSSPLFKDVFLTTFGLGIPSLINAASLYASAASDKPFTIELFLNCLAACVCLIISCGSSILWYNTAKKGKHLYTRITSRPQYKI
jgi:hypothetical protein